ncbi:TetR/AcrR family transcriptional regulator [Catenuloplanes indicus]|uniref:AcrR family transcriptional regulator n=1 Tax=Catenuloplanes indicus TaxID=137267 RepID=A0AAE4AY21_9ACTN|nr:TetR/AcrR family transcriptional regulator [Catenuloplanes indicus]MDQ0366331.1 AcrR family transcriptional regulator [Catenuloplanes indicus]
MAAKPLRRDAELNRQRILQAARELFAAQGLDVTLDDIAHHAGLGVGTVYRRFPTKDALVEALFESKMARLAQIAENAADEPDPAVALDRWLRAVADLQAGDRGLREVMLGGRYSGDRVTLVRERLNPAVTRLFDRAKAAGVLREDLQPSDVPVLMVMIGAVTDYSRPVGPDVWLRFLTILRDGLAARRDAPTPLPGRHLTEEEVETAMSHFRVHRP